MRSIALFISLLALCAALFMRGNSEARAQLETSGSFMTQDATVNTFGGAATSTSFELVNAATDIETGQSSSTNFLLKNGPLDWSGFEPRSQYWRWYNDEANPTPATPLANENTAPTGIDVGNIVKLRLTIKEVGGTGLSGAKFKLQFSLSSDFSGTIGDVAATSTCGGTAWCYAEGGGEDNQVVSSTVLSDPDSCSGGSGAGCGTHNETPTASSTFTHQADAATEYEFTITNNDAELGETYFFRAFDVASNRAVPVNGTSTHPSLVTQGATLSVSVNGLSSGTTTEGATTTVTSTATGIAFGELPFDVPQTAAQRLTITTNAAQGYQILALHDQDLMNASFAIPGVNATNTNPLGWTTACISTSTGCFGYHAGDNTLAGGSTRFAADDTFARFETDGREIAYSSGPVVAESTDMVFRILVRTNQVNGDYENRITYIIVPTY